jgi:hypothetical protein
MLSAKRLSNKMAGCKVHLKENRTLQITISLKALSDLAFSL